VPDDLRARIRFAAALLLSVVAHAGALLGFERLGGDPDPVSLATPKAERAEQPRLGIRESQAATVTWIGYEQYERHLARQAEHDQAAMSPESSAAPTPNRQRSTPSTPGAAASARLDEGSGESPQPATRSASSEAEEQPTSSRRAGDVETRSETQEGPRSGPRAVAAESETPEPTKSSEQPGDERTRREERPSEAEREAEEASRDPGAGSAEGDDARSSADRPEQSEREAGAEGRPSQADGSQSSLDEPSNPSDREAQAFSREQAPVVRPGRPLAAQGLEIKTVRPRFSHYTRLTASPSDPLVLIRFDREGRVQQAVFLERTGRSDVDAPLLDAIYQWRASGERIEALPEKEAGAERAPTVDIAMVIRLGG